MFLSARSILQFCGFKNFVMTFPDRMTSNGHQFWWRKYKVLNPSTEQWFSQHVETKPRSSCFVSGVGYLVGGLEHEFYDFPYSGNVMIPTDFHSIIFQRGRYTTNQLCELPHKYLKGSKSMAFPAFSQHVQTLSRGQEWGLICYKQAPSAPWAVKMKFQRERGNWYHRENINCIRWYWHVDFCQFSIFVGILSFHTIMQYTGCV